MAKVSVILPVYGVAEYIEACTKSLLAQTLDEVEFLFVDDHGPDDSIAILQRTIEGHPRASQFRVLTPEHNLGAGMARNFGIPEAQGEYISFIDPDDTVEPDMLEVLYNKAKASDSDICCCYMQKCFPDGSTGDLLVNPHVAEGELTHEKRAYILTHYVSLFASMIYRREMILAHDIRFPEDRAADDSYFVSCVWMKARSVAYVDRPLYHYLIRPGSVTTTMQSDKYKKRLAVFGKLMQYAKDHGAYDEFKHELDYMYLKKGYLSSVANYIRNSRRPQAATYREIYDELMKQVPDYQENSYYRSDKKMQALIRLLRCCPSLATVALRWYIKKNNIIT
ncbi:MAG: glycosyltransferase [Bacteroidales bacterium]|nr:glycosyltransferase [Bacteroidales bacterium]